MLPVSIAPGVVAKRLNPRLRVLGTETVLIAQAMAAVPNGLLATPVANLSGESYAITAAIDMVFQGF